MINPEERLKEIQKEITKVVMLESPGTIMVGVGLYAKFAANGDTGIEILNNQSVVNGMLILGAVIMCWGASRLMSLLKERSKISNSKISN